MAFFDNIFSRKQELDVDDYLNNMEIEEEPEEVDFWIKPISLQTNAEVEEVIRELKERNIVLLDIENLSKEMLKEQSSFLTNKDVC